MWRLITHNFGWKLGSLVLAVALWFAIVGEPELVTTRDVPILYKNLPPDTLIGSDAVDSVRLELRGPSGRLSAASLADLTVTLDLASVNGPGERTFTLSDSSMHLPENVTFLRAIPSQLRLRFARRKMKEVPVQVRFLRPPPSGYEIVGQQVIPEMLQVAGPEPRVDATGSAQTDAIDLSAVTQASEIRVNTFVADPQVWLQSSPMVTVKLKIEKSGK
ncbi:MAG TPA: CdaR family protein [Bryobacteraceae bacterium]|nr:CdaR family protein [Bryobacteraceae bacterium]